MKTIIHPTDFSKNAAKALDFAIGFSAQNSATLIVLYVSDLPTAMNTTSSSSSYAKMEDEARMSIMEQLENYVTSSNVTIAKNIKIQFQVEFNSSTTEGILGAINESEADLVVVGTKGRSKLRELIVGSTTKALISKAFCPVLAVPEKAVYSGINHIVYASDFNPNDLEVIHRTTDVAQINEAEFSVLHISKQIPGEDSDAAAFQQWLTEVVKYPKMKFDTHVSDRTVQALAKYMRDNNADLVVFFEKENSFIGGLFHKGTVNKFVDHLATIPLMSYNIHSIGNVGEE